MSKKPEAFFSEERVPSKKETATKPTNGKGRKLSSSKTGRTWGLVIGLILVGGFVALIAMDYAGLFSVFKPTITNEEDYIGYYKVRVFVKNDTNEYNQVNCTLTVFDYYDDHLISNITADGNTIYQAINVSMAYISYVDDLYTYPNATILLLCNKTQSTATMNDLYISRCGSQSEIDAQIYKIDDTYGDFNIGDIVSANVTIGIQITNLANGTFGENYYIPEPVRRNVNCTYGALWLRVNKHLDEVYVDGNLHEIFYDELGNTYISLYTVNAMRTETQILSLIGSEIPTEMKLIQGQFDGTLLYTF